MHAIIMIFNFQDNLHCQCHWHVSPLAHSCQCTVPVEGIQLTIAIIHTTCTVYDDSTIKITKF